MTVGGIKGVMSYNNAEAKVKTAKIEYTGESGLERSA